MDPVQIPFPRWQGHNIYNTQTYNRFLSFHFIESPSRQNEVYTSANDSLATIDIPIPPQHIYDIDILVSENEQNITEYFR